MVDFPHGLYERLFDEELREVLEAHPELRSIFGKIEADEEPARFAAFLANVLEKVLKLQDSSADRLELCNAIIERVAGTPAADFLLKHRLIAPHQKVLLEITPPQYLNPGIPRPETPLSTSSLFTGSPRDPQLVRELAQEMGSADGVDMIVSFIKWSGLRLLIPAFEELAVRLVPLRVITTSYMGASDAEAIQWLATLPNASVRISYDTERTRLHAKAYHFKRNTGFSTAYIGSANMSHAAMTSGLEWNLKVTAQDLPHIVEKFVAEFETYWNSHEFVPFNPEEPELLRDAIRYARSSKDPGMTPVFFDIRPHPFQERILDALQTERLDGHRRNLVVAATGTGKTVVAAFDFKRFYDERRRVAKLLFVAHRREILEQAIATFRAVLRISDFGELLVGPHVAVRLEHLFCSIDMLQSRRLWDQVGRDFYDFIVIDEVHHGPAASYRNVFEKFEPNIMLGLTATPERMDGQSVAADFGNRFAAEIRLPEALDEKLLCPFHYFAVGDPISIADDRFWRNGKYDVQALENVYTGAHASAKERVLTIVSALERFEPDLSRVRGIGFCVSVRHAEFMAEQFKARGIRSGVLVGETDEVSRSRLLNELRSSEITFLFTRDVLSEGLDVPEVNTVLFLRPTESLTVFLQQLGRGLRHAPEKDCLTVLDLVGQVHRKYRIDRKLKALLSKVRFNIEREVEMNFPHLPPGCSIQLDRIARDHVLTNIRENLRNLSEQVPERLRTFEVESEQTLTFANFVRYHDYDPAALLVRDTWIGWRSRAGLAPTPADPDRAQLQKSLVRVADVNGRAELQRLRAVASSLRENDVDGALRNAAPYELSVHYRLWGKAGSALDLENIQKSFESAARNPEFLGDVVEILEWAESESRVTPTPVTLPYPCSLELHANYTNNDIKAALGMATFESAGQTGVGLLHSREKRTYAALITYQKTEREFSPTTMYADYPISRELLHWESPSNTTQAHETGQNLIHHSERGYTILVFARATKKEEGRSAPFTFLGPASRVSFQQERPIQIVWRLSHPMPAQMFEENRRGG